MDSVVSGKMNEMLSIAADSSYELKRSEWKYPEMAAYRSRIGYRGICLCRYFNKSNYELWQLLLLNHISLLLFLPTSQLEDTMSGFSRMNNMFIETLYCDVDDWQAMAFYTD
uniref:Uncharacterized protein n=1 Tax=Glossina austeni TaxID=7395 RepID=A0A1A9VHD0_GLOAU